MTRRARAGRTRRRRRLAAVAALVLAGAALSAVPAAAHVPGADEAHVLWANAGGTTIGRAELDGTAVDQAFITGASAPRDVAINGTHVFWTHNPGAGRIGRASIDGSAADHAFLATAGPPQGVALDNRFVYWTNDVSGAGRVGRATLGGFGANHSFIESDPAPCGVAVSPDDVYWANGGTPGSIGNAHINGEDVHQDFIAGADGPCGVARTEEHVYWANRDGDSIGRAAEDGDDVDQTFIATEAPCGVAVDGEHIYWSTGNDTIARANLDGTGVDESFITGAQDPCGVAVSPTARPPASHDFGEAPVGSRSQVATLFVANAASSVLDVTGTSVYGTAAHDFAITGDGCTVNATPAAGGCIVNVQFRPSGPGPRHATLRVVSNAGNSPTDIQLTGVGLASAGAPDAGDTRPPRIHAAWLRPRVVRPGARAHLAYFLSEPARTELTLARRVTGRRVGGECVSAAARGARACRRLAEVARLAHDGVAGPNLRRLPRRFNGGPLPRGRYRLTLVATDAAGNASAPRSVPFRVGRRR